VRKPQTKGKVERLVNYVKDNFLPGRKFKDLYDLNSQALMWCRKVDSKVHGTTGEIPLEALSKEPLLPLPDKAVRDKYRWETRKVTRDGVVSYDGAKYGIPWQYSGREASGRRLRIWSLLMMVLVIPFRFSIIKRSSAIILVSLVLVKIPCS
jgi:hypothetical protein